MIMMLLPGYALGRSEEDLAKKLANPVSSLSRVPIKVNYDENLGPNERGSVWRTNIQPVFPFALNDEWNLISCTIVPVIDQDDIPTNGLGESGVGDIIQSLFFSPKEPTSGVVRYWADSPDNGAEGWGVRLQLTFLLSK